MNLLEHLPDNIKEHINLNKGNLLDGYIRFLNKDEISDICEIFEKSPMWDGGIPFATTAFADAFVWNEGYVLLYKFIKNDYNVILSGTSFFFNNVNDKDYQKDFFDIDLYKSAIEKYGEIHPTECFTFEPLLSLGGRPEISYIHVGEMKTYLNIVINF